MNKGICVFIVLFTLSGSLFPMEWSDENINDQVDFNIQKHSILLPQNENIRVERATEEMNESTNLSQNTIDVVRDKGFSGNQAQWTISCQLCGMDIVFLKKPTAPFMRARYLEHILQKHVFKDTSFRSKFFSLNNNGYSCLFDNCTHVSKRQAGIFDHFSRYHLQAILQQYSLITKKEIGGTYLEKKIEELVNDDDPVCIQQGKGAVACQICNKGIGLGKKTMHEVKEVYLCHLMTHIKNKKITSRKLQVCELCDAGSIGNIYRKDIYSHLVDNHLEAIFEGSEKLFGRKITQEAVDSYFQNPTILDKNGKIQQIMESSSKKRKLSTSNTDAQNNNNGVIPASYQTEEFANVQHFIKAMDEKCAGPKGKLSIEEIEKHLNEQKE